MNIMLLLNNKISVSHGGVTQLECCPIGQRFEAHARNNK